MATECQYKQWEIDDTPFLTAMKMAAYWSLEPPLAFQYMRVHFRDAAEPEDGMQPNLQGMPYARLSPAIQYTVRKTWLRRNPGKTEADFLAAVRKKDGARYQGRLEEARKKQNG